MEFLLLPIGGEIVLVSLRNGSGAKLDSRVWDDRTFDTGGGVQGSEESQVSVRSVPKYDVRCRPAHRIVGWTWSESCPKVPDVSGPFRLVHPKYMVGSPPGSLVDNFWKGFQKSCVDLTVGTLLLVSFTRHYIVLLRSGRVRVWWRTMEQKHRLGGDGIGRTRQKDSEGTNTGRERDVVGGFLQILYILFPHYRLYTFLENF